MVDGIPTQILSNAAFGRNAEIRLFFARSTGIFRVYSRGFWFHVGQFDPECLNDGRPFRFYFVGSEGTTVEIRRVHEEV